MVALFDSQAAYQSETPTRDSVVKVDSPSVTIDFHDLPLGDYAFKLFHDDNGNGELDTDFMGIPSESYYFSNDASDPFSAPEWAEAKFILRSGKTRHVVDLSD